MSARFLLLLYYKKISSPHVQFIIKSRTSGPLLEQICIGPLLKKNYYAVKKYTHAQDWSPVIMIWQYVVVRPLWTACVSPATIDCRGKSNGANRECVLCARYR